MPVPTFGAAYQLVPTQLANARAGAVQLQRRMEALSIPNLLEYLPQQETFFVLTGAERTSMQQIQASLSDTVEGVQQLQQTKEQLLNAWLPSAHKLEVDTVGTLTPLGANIPDELRNALLLDLNG